MPRTQYPTSSLLITSLGGILWLVWTMLSLSYASYVSEPDNFAATHLKVACTIWTVSNLLLCPRALWMAVLPEDVPAIGKFTRVVYRLSLFSSTFIGLCYVLGWISRRFFM